MRYVWYTLYAFVTTLALYTLFFSDRERPPAPEPPPVVVDEPVVNRADSEVQIALILDTSSSMDGLIEQARTQLWEIVGEMQLDDDDTDRTVAVALYQYGNNRLPKHSGFIEQMSELTTDLDAVSIKLQALRTSGGKEHAPEAIMRAIDELAWDDEEAVDKIIVIAGNESFSQGPISSRKAMAAAQKKGITVIPIFCANGGSTTAGVSTWKNAATLASTELETIDPNKVVAKLETPYDTQIVRKYQELQDCSLTYGSDEYRNQVKTRRSQAAGYVQSKGVALQAERAVVQSRQKVAGDLLDSVEEGSFNISTAAPSALPAELRGKSKAEQKRIVKDRLARKKKLQREIKELNAQRSAYAKRTRAKSKPSVAAGAPAPGRYTAARRKGSQGVVSGYSSESTLGASVRRRVRSK